MTLQVFSFDPLTLYFQHDSHLISSKVKISAHVIQLIAVHATNRTRMTRVLSFFHKNFTLLCGWDVGEASSYHQLLEAGRRRRTWRRRRRRRRRRGCSPLTYLLSWAQMCVNFVSPVGIVHCCYWQK